MESIFIKTLLTDKVKVKPAQLGSNIDDVLLFILKEKFESKCTYHGYIKPGSIKIEKYSTGYVQAFSLNGDIIYNVTYYAMVCNPSIGSVITAKVVNMNKFGLLAEANVNVDGQSIPVLEIIIAKSMINIENERPIDSIVVGDVINVEILGKKYELNDKKISVVGRIVQKDVDVVGGEVIAADDESNEGSEGVAEDLVESSDEEEDEDAQTNTDDAASGGDVSASSEDDNVSDSSDDDDDELSGSEAGSFDDGFGDDDGDVSLISESDDD
jgi:DNA-directed RNA polymerase subunit E'/Rpb7